jgi:hypothetical protein
MVSSVAAGGGQPVARGRAVNGGAGQQPAQQQQLFAQRLGARGGGDLAEGPDGAVAGGQVVGGKAAATGAQVLERGLGGGIEQLVGGAHGGPVAERDAQAHQPFGGGAATGERNPLRAGNQPLTCYNHHNPIMIP